MWRSDVLITVAYYFALFFIPFVAYIVLFEETKKKSTRYKSPDWYYILKRFFAIPKINKLKAKCRKSQLALGEELAEQPRRLTSEKQTDTQTLYGLDQNGNSLFLKIILRQHRVAEVTLCLRLNNEKVYKLPNEPQVLLCSIPSRQWKAEGLSVTVVEPLRKIRVTYNGLLQNTSQSGSNENSGKVEHVKFNFIWNAADKPLYYPQDMPNALFSDALAREPWRDGHWIDLMGDERGYEQYGVLQGLVSGEAFPEDLILNLPSFRKRYWGTAEHFALHRDFSAFVVAEDGTLFNVGARSYEKGCAQLNYGTLLDNIANVHPVDQHDIRLEHIAENNIPDVIAIHLKANQRTLKCIITINHRNTSTTHSDALEGWELKTITTPCIVNSQAGQAFVRFWYPKHGPGVDLPDPLLTEPKIDFPQHEYVAPFSSRDCRLTHLSGGKGSSLALLSSLSSGNFVVPEGFVVLVPAFKHQLDQNEKLSKAVSELADVSRGRIEKDLAIVCKETVDLFSSEPINQAVVTAILQELDLASKQAGADTLRWAVRSSGLSEDSEELSSAGQNATILGCATQKDVLQAVADCWGSLFGFQSVQYRRQHGLDINCSMAVVIQRMVASETAGVLFSCHPTTGDPSKIFITANYGLGESVVSGQADPDTIVLNRTWTGELSVHSQEVGSKKISIHMSAKGGETNVTQTSSDVAKTLSVTKEQGLLLGRVGIELERAFGSPRDIEWAFYKGKLYLLQSRPITTFNKWMDFELLHEFDTPILTNQELMTLANVAEVMPGALTVLSSSTINKIVGNNIYKFIMDVKEEPFVQRCIGGTHHHAVINVINSFLNKLDDKITIGLRVLEMAIFGHPVVDEKIHAIARARFGVLSKCMKARLLIKELMGALTIGKHVNMAIELASRFKPQLRKDMSALDMVDTIAKSLLDVGKSTEYHGRASHISVFFQIMAMNILAEGSDDLTTDHYYDISLLLSSCSNVVSAEIPEILESIANAIREQGLTEEFTRVDPNDGVNWLKSNCSKASKLLDSFLEDHGHRGLREFELKAASWGADPSAIIVMVQANCKTARVTKSSEYLNTEETIAKLVTPKSDTVRKILKFLLKRSRRSVAQREKTKSEMIRMVNEMRTAFRQLAQQMALEGIIPDPQLVYHFSIYELERVIKKRESALVQKAIRRQRLYPQWDKMKFPELMFGVPKVEGDNLAARLLRNSDSRVKLTGTPVCSGDVAARACVITDLQDIDQLQAGDILITHSTDVGWSPYFPMLAAVVTELGGLISHGAVVAREYGLPCIVGVRNATSVFKTGDSVLLSGKTGVLELMTTDINNK